MAGLSYGQFGRARLQREQSRLGAEDVLVALREWDERSYSRYCDEQEGCYWDNHQRCDMCTPDWRERDEDMRKLERAAPKFSLAERVLAQAGLFLKAA